MMFNVGDILERDDRRYQVTRISPPGSAGTRVSDGPTFHATIVDPTTGQARRGGFTADIWSGSATYPTHAYRVVSE